MESKFLNDLGIKSTAEFGKKYKGQLQAYCEGKGLQYEGYSISPSGTMTVYARHEVPISEVILTPVFAPAKQEKKPRPKQEEAAQPTMTFSITNKQLSNVNTEELKKALNDDLKEAMRAKDSKKTGALRLIKAAIETAEKAEGRVEPVDWMKVLLTESKKRQQAADSYAAAGPAAAERLEQELYEKAVIESFLPAKQSEEETLAHLTVMKAELGLTGAKEMGKLIKEFQSKFPGLQDGGTVSKLAKSILV